MRQSRPPSGVPDLTEAFLFLGILGDTSFHFHLRVSGPLPDAAVLGERRTRRGVTRVVGSPGRRPEDKGLHQRRPLDNGEADFRRVVSGQ